MKLKDTACLVIPISENKTIEIQLDWGWRYNMASEWFEFILKSRSKQDHWGAEFRLTLLNLICLMIEFYDNRHYENNDVDGREVDA